MQFKMISTEGYAELLEILVYDKDKGCFYWGVQPDTNRVKKGDRAGSKDGRGYYCIRYNSRLYPVHKLVWLKEYGFLPTKLFVDHINHDRGDSRKENLRLVNRSLNSLNRPRDNKALSGGFTNISGVSNKFFFVSKLQGRVKRYGPYKTTQEAVEFRDQFISAILDDWKSLVLEVEGVLIP